MKKHICFLTGTRADFGKLKPLIRAVESSPNFTYTIIATGMHLLPTHGLTYYEIQESGFKHIHTFANQSSFEPMELQLANTIRGLSSFFETRKPDLLVIHGDRVEALGGAIAGSLRNILVAHIEGGELSGSVDELLRHATTKMSHVHFVSNAGAARRLKQLGENPATIFSIGSPETDIILSGALPSLAQVKKHYEIPFAEYAVATFHPVTTEPDLQRTYAEEFVAALHDSGDRYVVIYPNNDQGSEKILTEYSRLKDPKRFRLLPSMRFEYFLALMKHAQYLIGNSSAGIREAPLFGVPSVNIGTRQQNRHHAASIVQSTYRRQDILQAIVKAKNQGAHPVSHHFGNGGSADAFLQTLSSPGFWKTPIQKQFIDIGELAQQTSKKISQSKLAAASRQPAHRKAYRRPKTARKA